MKALFSLLVLFQFISIEAKCYPDYQGQQPQVAKDLKGNIRVVYGRNDSIFCLTSQNEGSSFSTPTLVGVVKGMHLGMARGPQLASSRNVSMVTAMNKEGNILYFTLTNNQSKWSAARIINDVSLSAPEGLMNIAADMNDNFYAVWLDTRIGKRNNICFSKLAAGGKQWHKNTIIYTSPDQHVCECCRPSIAVDNNKVSVMFRNWLNGSRDLYMVSSNNSGNSFSAPIKLGEGTWKLNGCPMDGGGLAYNSKNTVSTVWRRKNEVYYFIPGGKEQLIGEGRNVSITEGKNEEDVAFTQNGEVKMKSLGGNKVTKVGNGDYLKLLILKDKMLCVWEEDHSIKLKVI